MSNKINNSLTSTPAAFLCCIGLLAISLLAAAPGNAAQSEQAVQELIDPYPRAEVVESSTAKVADHRLATGSARKVGGRWAPEKELRRAGELSEITVQIPEGHGPEEVFQYYRQRLAAVDARAIYLCRQRNCGSSNSWANDVFEDKQLYGLDQHQYYGIFEVVDDQNQLNYVVVYTVRRGNGRVYAHLELLQTEQESEEGVAPDPNAIVEQLRDQGYYGVSGVQLENGKLDFQPEHIAALAQALRSNRRLSVRIVGHDYGSRPLSEQKERSLAYAQRLSEKLTEASVDGERLEAHGVGSLVPMRTTAGRRDKNFRLELVVAQ